MNKIKGFVKKNYKIVIGFILGIIVCVGIGVSAVATKDIEYDNSTSGLTSTNLQGAIDELNIKAEKVYSKKIKTFYLLMDMIQHSAQQVRNLHV